MQTSKVTGYMTEPYGAGRNRGNSPTSDDPNSQIASKLRALYLSVQEEAVPDRFLDLLEKLDAAEQRSATALSDRS